jgi:hypothetical protein
MPGSHWRPAQIYQEQFEALGGLGCSLEPWKIELFKDGVCSDALDAIVTHLASDIPQRRGPRVRWCYGLGCAKALDEAHGTGSFSAGKRI